MLCLYGAKDIFIDVTAAVKAFYLHDTTLVLPEGPKGFNEIFTDPIYGVVKTLIIHLNDGLTLNIDENDHQPYIYQMGSVQQIHHWNLGSDIGLMPYTIDEIETINDMTDVIGILDDMICMTQILS